MKPKKVVHLTIGHPPDDGRILHKYCKNLSLTFETKLIFLPVSKNSKFPIDAVNQNLSLHALDLSENKMIRFIQRRFFLSYFLKKKFNEIQLFPDLIHTHETESLRLALKYKKSFPKCKVIFDAHEFTFMSTLDRKPPLYGFIRFLHRLFFLLINKDRVDYLFAANDITRSFFLAFMKSDKCLTVSNESIFKFTSPLPIRNEIILVHEGNLDESRGIDFLISFLCKYAKDSIKLRVIGEIPKAKQKEIDQLEKQGMINSNCIKVLGWQEYSMVKDKLSGHIGIITMKKRFNNLLAGPPNKLFNYLSSSMPVISFDLPATTQIINRYNVGRVSKRDIDDFYKNIKKISSEYSCYTKRIADYKDNFMFKKNIKVIEAAYNELL